MIGVIVDYKCPLDKSQKPIIFSLLGELSLLQIIESYANSIYLIGIVTDMAFADGNYYTPYEFMHHDLTHRSNRNIFDKNISINEIKFINYIKINTILTYDDKYKIYIMLFILIHESVGDVILNKQYIMIESGKSGKSAYEYLLTDLNTNFLYYYIEGTNTINSSWTDANFLGGLLPEDTFPRVEDNLIKKYNSSSDKFNMSKTIIEDKHVNIPEYLEGCAHLFIIEWNKCFSKQFFH